MARMKLEITGLDKLLERIDKMGSDSKKVCEEALRETHKIVTQKAEEGMAKSNLPAGGKYSYGDTLRTLRREALIYWNGDVASVPVGFDINNGGLTSIFLMYGTPRMKKDQTLYNAFFGAKTRKEILEAQENVFYSEIRRLEG